MVFQAKDRQIAADSFQPARVSKQEVKKGAAKPMSEGADKMRPQPRGKPTGNVENTYTIPSSDTIITIRGSLVQTA